MTNEQVLEFGTGEIQKNYESDHYTRGGGGEKHDRERYH